MSPARKVAVVTGGAGFIGSHMVDVLLDRGYRVRVIDNLTGGRTANLAHHARAPNLSLPTPPRKIPSTAKVPQPNNT